MRLCVSKIHLSTIWISSRVHSGDNFKSERVYLHGTGLLYPADGFIAVWITREAEVPYFRIFSSQSMKILMMLSMNISLLPRSIAGHWFACACGIDFVLIDGLGKNKLEGAVKIIWIPIWDEGKFFGEVCNHI